jgi:hypothetical protein
MKFKEDVENMFFLIIFYTNKSCFTPTRSNFSNSLDSQRNILTDECSIFNLNFQNKCFCLKNIRKLDLLQFSMT